MAHEPLLSQKRVKESISLRKVFIKKKNRGLTLKVCPLFFFYA